METEQDLKILEHIVIYKKLQLGKGSFGEVFKGKDLLDEKNVAVKIIPYTLFDNDSSQRIENVRREAKNMARINHNNVVKLFDVKKTPNNIYMIMEFCDSGNLEELLKKNNRRLSEDQSVKIIQQIVEAFKCMYDNNIVHRDLKPANILIHNGQIKVADFGFSKIIEEGMDKSIIQSIVGSPLYMAPQILQGDTYSSKSDIWSLGIIFYQMLYGRPPWIGNRPMDMSEIIENKKLNFPEIPAVDENIKKLITQMLQKKESDRISWKQIFDHQIIKQNNEKLHDSIKSVELSYKHDFLMNSQQLNQIYYDENKTILNIFDIGRQKKNELIFQLIYRQNDSKQQDQSGNNSVNLQQQLQNSKSQNQSNNSDTIQSLQKDLEIQDKKYNEQQKATLAQINKWVLHRRNLAAFYMSMALQLFDIFTYIFEQSEYQIKNSKFQRFIYVLIKYHMLTMFRLYRTVKQQHYNGNKFTQQQLEIFWYSIDRNYLVKQIKDDINMSSMFFKQYLEYLNNLKKKNTHNWSEDELQQLNKLGPILDNKQTNKNIFKEIWIESLQEFYQYSIDLVKQKILNSDKQLRTVFLLKILVENRENIQFKLNSNNIDFSKLYQYVDRIKISKVNDALSSNLHQDIRLDI